MCECVDVYTCECVYCSHSVPVCTCSCVCVWVHTCEYIHVVSVYVLHIFVSVFGYTCEYVYTCSVPVFVYVCLLVCWCMHVSIYI